MKPIFIVGAPRSGTTLLRYVLCSHPRIYMPPESNFIPHLFARRPTDPLEPDDVLRLLERIETYTPFWRDWDGDPPDPASLVEGLVRITPADLIDALYRRYAARFGAERWGDKSPLYASHVPLLTTMFPQAQVVHIVRDPRDVVASSLAAYRGARFFYMDPFYAARTWRRRVDDATSGGTPLGPHRYHQVRYEDLTLDPEREIRALCRFLGEPFDPSMTAPETEARRHHHSGGIHAGVRNPITPTRAGRWRTALSRQDARLVQETAGPALRALGYRSEDLGPAPASARLRTETLRAKYAVTETARRALWTIGVANPTRLLELRRRQRSSVDRASRRTVGRDARSGESITVLDPASTDAAPGG